MKTLASIRSRRRTSRLISEGVISGEDFKTVQGCFSDTTYAGLYTRTLRIKKNTMIVGRIHTQPHIFTVVSGDILVQSQDVTTRYDEHTVITTSRGTQRCIYALADSIITTVHSVDESINESNAYDKLTVQTVQEYNTLALGNNWQQIKILPKTANRLLLS
jgi:hypothetical protein